MCPRYLYSGSDVVPELLLHMYCMCEDRRVRSCAGAPPQEHTLGYLMDYARALVPYVQRCCSYEVYKYTCAPIAVLPCEAIAVNVVEDYMY